MSFKNKAIEVLEKQLTRQAMILEVRAWEADTFFELDLHIPDADFSAANVVQHIKCRVAPLSFRDYTISGWDAETKTCTLFIDATHPGAGSKWISTLTKPGEISYLKIEQHRYPAMQHGSCLFLGDQSTVGHFLALKQMTNNNPNINGVLIIPNNKHAKQLKYFYPDLHLEAVALQHNHSHSMIEWLQQHPVIIYDTICIAGNNRMVTEARSYLKSRGVHAGKIKVQGFWE